jgi:predicted metalloprotease
MRWEGGEQSDNVEDRRGAGGLGGSLFGGRSIGIGTLLIAVVAGLIFGVNPLQLIGMLGGTGGPAQMQQAPSTQPPGNDHASQFIRTVLRDTELVWDNLFKQAGGTIPSPSS